MSIPIDAMYTPSPVFQEILVHVAKDGRLLCAPDMIAGYYVITRSDVHAQVTICRDCVHLFAKGGV